MRCFLHKTGLVSLSLHAHVLISFQSPSCAFCLLKKRRPVHTHLPSLLYLCLPHRSTFYFFFSIFFCCILCMHRMWRMCTSTNEICESCSNWLVRTVSGASPSSSPSSRYWGETGVAVFLGRYMSMMRTKAKKRLCFVAIIVSFSSRLTCVFASRGRKQVVVTFAYAASEANELVTKIKTLVG